MIWIVIAAIIAFLIWYKGIKPMSYWRKLGVKQSKPWPFVGDSGSMIFPKISLCDYLDWVYNINPNVRYSGIYQFTKPALIIKDPDLIKQITVKDFDHFTDHSSVTDVEADPLITGNLFVLKGQKWREMRATLSGCFTSSKMKVMFHLMEEAAKNFVQYFLDKNEDLIEIEMKDTYTRYTNDVIATTAFGIQCDSMAEPNNEFYQMGKSVINNNGIKATIKFVVYMLTPKLFKLLKLTFLDKAVTTFFRSIINETIRTREEKGIVRPDMINLLLEARKGIKDEETNEVVETGYATVKESSHIGNFKQIKNVTNDDITAQALIFFFAGFDTISTGLCFGTYELVANKDIQDKLRKEIKETYEENNGIVTYDILLKMKYLDMVVSEILRKWPPAVIVDRVVTKPYVIEPVTSDERPVPLKVGDILWLPVYSYHRDPANYPNPDKFDPERFSDENKANIKPYTYMPFGSGPRNCIASRFALLEIKALLFHLLLNFEIVPSEKTVIPIKLSKNMQLTAEGGFWFAFKRIKT